MSKITRRNFLKVSGVAAAAAALTACGGSASSAAASSTSAAAGSTASSTAAALSGNVATGGSTSMKNVIAALTEGFAEVEPGVTVSYDPTGSGAGITGATDKTLDIGLSSRALKDDEKADVEGTTIALDGIAIIVNNASKVEDLTVDQLKQMFTGEITNWSEVGGDDGEIVLIGQDTGIWGTDFADEDVAEGSPRNLAQLLRAVAEAVRPHNVWVRVLYLQPEGMTDELIDTICDTPEVLPYIDIPVQHCDARILKAMRRSGSRQELEDLFRDLRERIPGIVIRSTAMVGFPTETDDEFRDLIDFMDTVGFDYTSVFAYSQEEGSLAAKMEGQVDEEVKLERAQEAMDLAESLGFAATAAHVGERAQVIVDGIEETEDGAELIGHAWFQAPDSDGAVHLDASEASVGDILTVEFTDSFCYELIGHVVE